MQFLKLGPAFFLLILLCINIPPVHADAETFISESSLDGQIRKQGPTYPPLPMYAQTALSTVAVGQMYKSATYFIYRSYLSFDTSTIPDNANVSSATLKMKTESDYSGTDFMVYLCGGTQPIYGGSLEIADWGCGTSKLAEWNTSNYQDETWINFTVPIAQINKQGRTQFELRSSREGTTPTGNEYVKFYSDPTILADYPPQLKVSWTLQEGEQEQQENGLTEEEEGEIPDWYVPPESEPSPLQEIMEEKVKPSLAKYGLFIIIGIMGFLVLAGGIKELSLKKVYRKPKGKFRSFRTKKKKQPRGPKRRF